MKPDTIKPGDLVIRCPNPACLSDKPAASCVQLRTWVIRNGQVVSFITGERVSCQSCATQYSIGPTGVFQHNLKAQPVTAPMYELPALGYDPRGDIMNKEAPPTPERPLQPMGRRPPPV